MKPKNHMKIHHQKIGVIMVNLGTPESQTLDQCGNILENFK